MWFRLHTILGTFEGEKRIYSILIFPCFSKLTLHERKQHLEYIRDYLFDDVKHDAKRKNKKGSQASQFIAELKSLKRLLGSSNSNELLTVSSFCDHNVEIFTTFPKYFCSLMMNTKMTHGYLFFVILGFVLQ